MSLRLSVAALLLVAHLAVANSDKVELTNVEPTPEAGENVHVYNSKFPTCEQLNGLYACTAEGHELRVCYAELEIKKEFIISQNEYEAKYKMYIGNPCMQRAHIGHFLCRNGIESGHFNKMICLGKEKLR